MSILLCSLFSALVWAQSSWVEIPGHDVPVYKTPDEMSDVLYYAYAGEKVSVRGKSGRYTKIRLKRKGKWRTGYVATSDLKRKRELSKDRNWGFGGALWWASLSQKSKSFTTEDQVEYTTTEFKGSSIAPAFAIQFGERDFWRFAFALRNIAYETTATTNVVNSAPRDIEVDHRMYSVMGQRVWSLGRFFYLGFGLEYSRSYKATVKIGGSTISSDDAELPSYFGIQGVVGTQTVVAGPIGLAVDLRPVYYVNQSPTIQGFEAMAYLFYWL